MSESGTEDTSVPKEEVTSETADASAAAAASAEDKDTEEAPTTTETKEAENGEVEDEEQPLKFDEEKESDDKKDESEVKAAGEEGENPAAETEESKPMEDTDKDAVKEEEKDGATADSAADATKDEVDVEMKDEPEAENVPDAEVPVETPTPKRKRGRPPKRKSPKAGGATTPASAAKSATTTPSATRSSKRKTPVSAKSVSSATTPSSSTKSPPSSSKRQRRAAKTFEPSNFKAERLANQALQQCPPGRGVALSSLDVVKANISKKKNDDAILHGLYRFVLGTMGLTGRGKPGTGKIKSSLLEFSGFLSPEDGQMDVDGEDRNAKDAEMKEKFQSKAEGLSVSALKAFCDILQLRSGAMKKAELVEKIVEFLAAPSESLLQAGPLAEAAEAIAASKEVRKKRGRGRPPKDSTSTAETSNGEVKKKRRPGRPRKKRPEDEENLEFEEENEEEEVSEEEEEPEPDDDDQDEVIDGKTIPSAKKLRKWVNAYVTVFNLDTCTAKHAIATASEKFGVDMEFKKDVIIEMLKEAV